MSIKWIAPCDEALGITTTRDAMATGYSVLRKGTTDWGYQMKLRMVSGYTFSCCGAGEISSLTGQFNTDKDLQETALMLYRRLANDCITYYAIASTAQLQMAAHDTRHVLQLLQDLGLKEIHKTPNRNHGPNNMHMMVLDPTAMDHKAIREKYFWEACPGVFVPKYVQKLDEKAQLALIAEWQRVQETRDARQREEAIKAKETMWNTKLANLEQLLYSVKADDQRRPAYESRGIGHTYIPNLPDKTRNTFIRYLNTYGWRNENVKPIPESAPVQKSQAVGSPGDTVWAAQAPVQKW